MLRKLILVIIITLISSSQSFAFDGERKGLIVDAGIGYSNYSLKIISTGDKIADISSLGFNMFFGYSFDNKNPLVLETINIGNFTEESIGRNSEIEYYGISWYHYFSETEKSIFSIVGSGHFTSSYRNLINMHENETSAIGLIVGLGYEFSKGKNIKFYQFFNRLDYGDQSGNFHIPYFSLSISLF